MPGRFDDDIYPDVFPRNLARILFVKDLNSLAIDNECSALDNDLPFEWAMDRVVLEQIRQRCRLSQVIHGYKLKVGIVKAGSQNERANPP